MSYNFLLLSINESPILIYLKFLLNKTYQVLTLFNYFLIPFHLLINKKIRIHLSLIVLIYLIQYCPVLDAFIIMFN